MKQNPVPNQKLGKLYIDYDVNIAVESEASVYDLKPGGPSYFPKVPEFKLIAKEAVNGTSDVQSAMNTVYKEWNTVLDKAETKQVVIVGKIWDEKSITDENKDYLGYRAYTKFELEKSNFSFLRDHFSKLELLNKYPDYKGHYDKNGTWVPK